MMALSVTEHRELRCTSNQAFEGLEFLDMP